MVCYVAVPSRPSALKANPSRRDKLTATADRGHLGRGGLHTALRARPRWRPDARVIRAAHPRHRDRRLRRCTPGRRHWCCQTIKMTAKLLEPAASATQPNARRGAGQDTLVGAKELCSCCRSGSGESSASSASSLLAHRAQKRSAMSCVIPARTTTRKTERSSRFSGGMCTRARASPSHADAPRRRTPNSSRSPARP